MRFVRQLILGILLTASSARPQSSPALLEPILSQKIQAAEVTAWELRGYVMEHVPPQVFPQSAPEWSAEAKRLRQQLLDDVVFHGWPKEWVNTRPRFEDLGIMESGNGYRMRKVRYEIVPGFQSTGILYEPENLQGKVPAILNVNGHEYLRGKAVEYKQKRCINFAKRGILSLSLEWLNCGELSHPENDHQFAAHLDLVGANGVGLFYLAMRRGLDYLDEHPNVDRGRLGMTGLSGGGWQTIVLSSLDERVMAAVPVAGYSSLVSVIERPGGEDIEQIPTDFFVSAEYSHLTAMRAPRPTLLIYNAEDDCCFRAPLVKPHIFDRVRPFFGLFGAEDAFKWHENMDPGTHNYQLDNRLQAYRFFAEHFRLPALTSEIPVDSEIKGYDELVIGLPKDNLTILGLARKLATEIKRGPIPSNSAARAEWARLERAKLKTLVRYQPVSLKHPWAIANTKNRGVETRSYRFEMRNGLSATGVWVKAIGTADDAPITLVLNDKGKKELVAVASDRVNRGEQVLAVDLLFFGDASPGVTEYAQLLAAIGDRAIGIEAAQLIGITRWLQSLSGAPRVHLEASGIRSQIVALTACALEPSLFSELSTHGGMKTFGFLLDKPVTYEEAPDLFGLDLYKNLDVDWLVALAEPTKIKPM
jgi:dienelactone hydrolase